MTSELQKSSKTPVALDAELKDWLKHQAIDNRRTLSGEIAYRLEQSRKTEEAQHEKQT